MIQYLWRLGMWLACSPLFTVASRRVALGWLGLSLPFYGKISAGTYIGSRNVRFGQYFQSNVNCYFDGAVTFGDMVAVGACVRIITCTHSIGKADHRRGWDEITTPVTIGEGCWIGSGATIVCVDVAPGCVIAAGAVVTRATEPNGLYAGVPARRIRDLGDDREEFMKCL